MNLIRPLMSVLVFIASTTTAVSVRAAEGPSLAIVKLSDAGSEARFKPTSSQVLVARSDSPVGVEVTIQPGNEGYPGVDISPPESAKTWDLSNFGHVESRITNTGAKDFSVALRVDNDVVPGEWEPWNTETLYLKPGESGTVKLLYGYSYGNPGYKLNPGAVVRVKLFVAKDDAVRKFRVEAIEATGPKGEKKPVDPESIRIKPENGFILGNGASFDASKQLATMGAEATLGGDGALKVTFPAGSSEQSVSLKPPVGRWNLNQALEVRIALRNDGSAPITPAAQLISNSGSTEQVTGKVLKPGEHEEVVVPFASSKPLVADDKNNAVGFSSNVTAAIKLSTNGTNGTEVARSLVVESVRATLPSAAELPAWLGQRPPVEGQWTKTFEDNFDGTEIDRAKWNIYSENFWDQRTHFAKDNIIVADGMVKLRYEKKVGHENDDESRKTTNYASGFLDTYGKWVQRYGYFEARLKLPTAPGLWPAFWTMPDRGADKGPQWVRASTEKDGMELDIVEHLTRWGPYRYNIAHHWDGYNEQHKSNGSGYIYAQSDKDGFITAGVLWAPGSVVYYCNGKEVLHWKNPRIGSAPSYPILYMVSGGWDNDLIDDATLPSDFVIDYVRCWQRADLASSLDGPQPPAAPAR